MYLIQIRLKNHFSFRKASFCQEHCQSSTNCKAFLFNGDDKSCQLMKDSIDKVDEQSPPNTILSGPKNCPIDGNWTDYLIWTPCKGNGTLHQA